MSVDEKDLQRSMNRRQFLQAAAAGAASSVAIGAACLAAERKEAPAGK